MFRNKILTEPVEMTTDNLNSVFTASSCPSRIIIINSLTRFFFALYSFNSLFCGAIFVLMSLRSNIKFRFALWHTICAIVSIVYSIYICSFQWIAPPKLIFVLFFLFFFKYFFVCISSAFIFNDFNCIDV